ncbi:MAG: TatD family hydrolase [Chitinophagales bacterium]
MIQLIDTHAHLYVEQFDEDRVTMLQRAYDAGVQKIFLPNIDSRYIDSLNKLAEQYPQQCYPMMGVHPCSIKGDYKVELDGAYQALKANPTRFAAIGEIGLDFYWDLTYKSEQIEALKTQISWAKEFGLPIVLHSRDSFNETFEIVQSMNDENLTGIFHCFSGSTADAEKVISLNGFYMGLGGVVTYKNSKELSETIENIPLKYFVLETDAPYLVPHTYRKKKHKRNESAFIVAVAEKVAEIKKVSLEEVAAITTQNAIEIFCN